MNRRNEAEGVGGWIVRGRSHFEPIIDDDVGIQAKMGIFVEGYQMTNDTSNNIASQAFWIVAAAQKGEDHLASVIEDVTRRMGEVYT